MFNIEEKGGSNMDVSLRDKIINIATELFMVQGYVATSTRQISTKLNVSQPAIYHHFKNKEEIYLAVLTKFATEVGSALKEIQERNLPNRDNLVTMAEYLKENHPMNLSLMMHDMNHSISEETRKEIFKIWSMYYFNPFISFFSSMEDSLYPTLSSTIVSQHFLRILSAYITETYSKETLDIIQIKDMVDIFLRGITIPST